MKRCSVGEHTQRYDGFCEGFWGFDFNSQKIIGPKFTTVVLILNLYLLLSCVTLAFKKCVCVLYFCVKKMYQYSECKISLVGFVI